jgi:hypothetical protein
LVTCISLVKTRRMQRKIEWLAARVHSGMFGWLYGCAPLHGGMQNLAPRQAHGKRAVVSFLESQALAGMSHAASPVREENQTRHSEFTVHN